MVLVRVREGWLEIVAHYLLWGLGLEIINTLLCLVPDLINDNNYHRFSFRGGGVLAVHTRSPRGGGQFQVRRHLFQGYYWCGWNPAGTA